MSLSVARTLLPGVRVFDEMVHHVMGIWRFCFGIEPLHKANAERFDLLPVDGFALFLGEYGLSNCSEFIQGHSWDLTE